MQQWDKIRLLEQVVKYEVVRQKNVNAINTVTSIGGEEKLSPSSYG